MKSQFYRLIYVAAVAACALPTAAAQAQLPAKTPQAYCTALDKSYDRYIGSSHGSERMGLPGYAKAACKEHHPAVAIPIMEQALRESKLPLPPHRSRAIALRPETG